MSDLWLRGLIDLGAFFVAFTLAHAVFGNFWIAALLAILFTGGTDRAQQS